MTAPRYDELIDRARALVPALVERVRAAERLRRLPDATLADLRSSGLFAAFRPARYGGAELPFRGIVELSAILGSGCGSTAWVYNNLVSHNWMLGYWPGEAQDEVWRDDPGALVGSGLVMAEGEARAADGGFRITGHWPFASGIDAVQWVLLGGRVARAGRAPEPYLFLVRRGDVRIIDNWQAMGLAASGSKEAAADDLFVPAHRAMRGTIGDDATHPGAAVNPGALYRVPWSAVFSLLNVGPSLGIAQGSVRDFGNSIRSRAATYSGKALAELATLQMRLAEAAVLVDAAETVLLKDCDEVMQVAASGARPPPLDRTRWRRDGAYAAQLAARAVDIVFAGAGGSAINEAHPLQRALRDIHCANGHIGVSWDLNGALYGRVAFGLAAEPPR